ncbi:MAG TPA: c-type cytochrome [Gemmatimonadales bacterium]|nr:c-type cytochrome [Gemmatimonadales bacterium]
MRGGRLCFVLLNIAGVSMFLGCGDRRTGDAPATDTMPAASPAGGTTDTAATLPDSGQAVADSVRPAARGDSTPTRPAAASPASAPTRQTAAASERVSTRKPVLKPSTPARPPAAQRDTPPASTSATPPAPDTAAAATPSAQTADTTSPASAQANAPLRDEYHRAPLDTVSQQVYDGWKQYNLNCARCHGEDVLGSTIAPHLVASMKPNGPINTKELFVQTVCAGRPAKGMPAWCPLGLEMDKIEAIHAYVKGRSEGKIRPGRPAVKSEG